MGFGLTAPFKVVAFICLVHSKITTIQFSLWVLMSFFYAFYSYYLLKKMLKEELVQTVNYLVPDSTKGISRY